ncbi:MAG: di-trans,poly-cis-decaprenylcistransferase [Armatimonadetes bacterium]|nr:di-trans,poly-cis-decaprenylcistransferase [Armatimonadota bacterium]
MLRARDSDVRREETIWLSRLDPLRLPRHIAVIMDGNGRWARRRNLPRGVGHVRGADTVERIVRATRDLPELIAAARGEGVASGRVECLTLYTFSNENWRRPQDEVTGLMSLIERQLRDKLPEMRRKGVCIRLLGREEDLPESLREELRRDMESTAGNRDLLLYLALNYGGRREIVDAARRIAERAVAGELRPEELTEDDFAAHLYAPDVPEPELLIRTGGDMRVSNFLLWQIAYAELWVTPTLWPAFQPAELFRALVDFQTRDRRFGGLSSHGST